jgi:hypothetical protein
MDNEFVKKLCLDILKSDTEVEVIEILMKHGYWDNPIYWRWYGDKENNYKDAGNQAAEAESALVEKITNARDARLMGECLIRKIDPESKEAPRSLEEAVALFFDNQPLSIGGGLIRDWTDSKRTEIARGITLSTTGNKPEQGYPSITISDIGEGQSPFNIPKTILSLGESIKLRIPFVHGKFNMGGTAVLRFCGSQNLQLIISKRNPLLLSNNDTSEENWGFTVVRRNYPKGNLSLLDNQKEVVRSSIYTYLAPVGSDSNPFKGDVLNFASDELNIFPQGNKPYALPSKWGTVIKLFEYKTRYRTHMFRDGGLLRPLDLLLPRIGLPVRLHECREYKGDEERSFETTLTGLRVRLEDDKEKNMEKGFPDSTDLKVDGEEFKVTIYAFKEGKAKTYRNNDKGIIFTMNGQTQGWFPERFFTKEQKVGLDYIKDSLIVIVDCSKISFDAQEMLFQNARDRLSTEPIRYRLEQELEELLKRHEGLRELKERRRREKKTEKLEDSHAFEKVLKSLFKHSKSIAQFFSVGNHLANPYKSEEVATIDIDYLGERYPSYFKFKKLDYGKTLSKECHINKRARIFFETDVENHYFDREIDPGKFELILRTNSGSILYPDYRLNLYNGIGTLSLKLLDNVSIGDIQNFECKVTDSTRIIDPPFINDFTLTILKEQIEQPKSKKSNRRNPRDNDGNERDNPIGLSIPNPTEVYKVQRNGSKTWTEFGNKFDKETSLIIQYSGEDNSDFGGYDFFINMDNIYLNFEIKDNIEDAEIVIEQFKIGMVLVGMSLIHSNKKANEIKSDDDNDDKEISLEDLVNNVTKSLSPVLLPMINQLSDLQMDED